MMLSETKMGFQNWTSFFFILGVQTSYVKKFSKKSVIYERQKTSKNLFTFALRNTDLFNLTSFLTKNSRFKLLADLKYFSLLKAFNPKFVGTPGI